VRLRACTALSGDPHAYVAIPKSNTWRTEKQDWRGWRVEIADDTGDPCSSFFFQPPGVCTPRGGVLRSSRLGIRRSALNLTPAIGDSFWAPRRSAETLRRDLTTMHRSQARDDPNQDL